MTFSHNPKFSPYVLKAVVDVVTGGGGMDNAEPIGIYRSGPKLVQFFLGCNLNLNIGSSSRVPAVTELLRGLIQQPDGDSAMQRVIEMVGDPREYLGSPEKAAEVREHLNSALLSDGLELVVISGKAILTSKRGAGIVVEPLAEKAVIIDFDTVQNEIARAIPNLDADPEDAITAACSLIEAVCRSILVESDIELPANKSIDGLLKAVQVPLRLSPGRSDLPPEVETDVRTILSGLTTVVKSVGALRTHAGDAHGRERGRQRVDARIARMALNAASTVSLLLIETWEKEKGFALPRHADSR